MRGRERGRETQGERERQDGRKTAELFPMPDFLKMLMLWKQSADDLIDKHRERERERERERKH